MEVGRVRILVSVIDNDALQEKAKKLGLVVEGKRIFKQAPIPEDDAAAAMLNNCIEYYRRVLTS